MEHIKVKWQDGPIKEVGENGAQVVDVIKEAKERLEGLNKDFPCRENAMTITKLDEAIMWQDKRTADREARGVEGLNKSIGGIGMKERKSLDYYEKLEELINDRDLESIEWCQSNEEKEGYVECEVTFKFKKLLVQ